MASEFPSNSKTPKASEPEPKKVERVVEGEVIRRKKPLGRRFKETFGGGDAKGVFHFVLLDVLLPAGKNMVADAVSQGVERMVFGEVRSTSRSGGRNSGRGGNSNNFMDYQKRSDPRHRNNDREYPSRKSRASFDFDEIVVPTRVEAEAVIDQLFDLVAQFDVAKVSDLYSLVGVTGNYTDERYGWYDIRGFGITRISNGYLLDTPKPELLD